MDTHGFTRSCGLVNQLTRLDRRNMSEHSVWITSTSPNTTSTANPAGLKVTASAGGVTVTSNTAVELLFEPELVASWCAPHDLIRKSEFMTKIMKSINVTPVTARKLFILPSRYASMSSRSVSLSCFSAASAGEHGVSTLTSSSCVGGSPSY